MATDEHRHFEPWQYRLRKAKGTPWEHTVLTIERALGTAHYLRRGD